MILLIDSNKMTIDLYRDALHEAGYAVETAESGEKAFEKLEREVFSLAVISLNLSGMDGLETFMLLRQKQKDLAGILITGSGSMETAVQALELGFSSLLKKPVTPDELLRAIRRSLVKTADVEETLRLKTLLPLYHLWEQFIRAQTVDDVLAEFVAAVKSEMKTPVISVMMYDEKIAGLKIVAAANIDQRVIDATIVLPGDKIAGHVFATGEPVILNRGAEENSRFASFLHRDHIAAAISFPLKARTQIRGVLNISKEKPGEPFSQADVEMVAIISNQAVMALENVENINALTEKARTQTLFEQYMAPEVAELLIAHGKNPVDVGEVRDITVLFADIRHFTPLVREMSLENIRLFLNDFFSLFSETIFSVQGTLDKFMGDAVLAIFGAPNPLKNPERTAVAAALTICDGFQELHRQWVEKQPCIKNVGLGIGISSGEMFLGNVGSERRFDFTVIGNDVNLAQRLASAAKTGEIFVSAHVARTLTGQVPLRKQPPQLLRGMDAPVVFYSVTQ